MVSRNDFKKQAIMILIHNNFDYFKSLISLLDSKYFDIFIYVDKASDIEIPKKISKDLKESNVYFVENRTDVRWGDYSIVESELELLKLARSIDKYSYYHLLSGADFILKTPKEIHTFFEQANKTEFIQSFDISQNENFYLDRYKYNYKLKYPKKKTLFNKGVFQLYLIVNKFTQKILKVNRTEGINIELGSQWFSITDDLVEEILDKELFIQKTYRHTIVPDESFIQTIAFSDSKFSKRIVENNCEYLSIKRFIKFENGKPKVWTIKDLDDIEASSALFIRKVQEGVSDSLVEIIKNKLEGRIINGN